MAYSRKTGRKTRASGRSRTRRGTGGYRPARRKAVSRRRVRRGGTRAAGQQLKIVIEHAPAQPDYSRMMTTPQSTTTKRKGKF